MKYRWPLAGNPLLDFLVFGYGVLVYRCWQLTWPPTPPQDLKPRMLREYLEGLQKLRVQT